VIPNIFLPVLLRVFRFTDLFDVTVKDTRRRTLEFRVSPKQDKATF
jgi:hypothetical protein